MGFLKRLFCSHNFVFLRNVYGDERLFNGGKSSDWKCTKCGKLTYCNELVITCEGVSPIASLDQEQYEALQARKAAGEILTPEENRQAYNYLRTS